MPAVGEHLTPKFYVDQAVSNSVYESSSLLGFELLEKLKFDEQDSTFPNSTLTSPKTILEVPTKAYVDYLSENDRSKRDLPTVCNDRDNEFGNNEVTVLDSIGVIRNCT